MCRRISLFERRLWFWMRENIGQDFNDTVMSLGSFVEDGIR